jgi:hypothetical protein
METMKLARNLIVACAAVAAVGACSDGGAAPEAVVLSVTPELLDPSRDDADDLSLIVSYRDGDGDLGGGIAEVHDCRAEGITIVYDIPSIASDEAVDAGVPIEGRLELIVNDVGLIDIDSEPPEICAEMGVAAPVEGEVRFCVVPVDAAGHVGIGDCGAPVAIAVQR